MQQVIGDRRLYLIKTTLTGEKLSYFGVSPTVSAR